MKLVDMKLPKRSKKEMKERYEISSGNEEKYPYSLQITFEADQIKDLPQLKDKKVGDRCVLQCEAVVTSTRIAKRQNGKNDHSIRMQIEKVAINEPPKKFSKDMKPEEYKAFREQKM